MRIVLYAALAATLATASQAEPAGPLPVVMTSPPMQTDGLAGAPDLSSTARRQAHCANWGERRPYVSLLTETRRCRAQLRSRGR